MKIKIYVIGKIKDTYLKMGIEDYLTKIKPYCNIEVIELKDEPINDNPNDSDIKKAIDDYYAEYGAK